MRRRLALALCGLSLAGCGVLDDEGPAVAGTPDPAAYGPGGAVARATPAFEAPELSAPTGAVAQALDDGEIGVVDLTGTVAIEPSTLDTASDATLERVRWSRWDEDGAQGTGELRLLDCQPTCVSGGTDRVPATITLTGVKTCDGRRYFETGAVRLVTKDSPSGEPPATYIRAPC